MQSKATSVNQYISELPDERKKIISDIRIVINKNLPKGFEEGMSYGMIGFYVPHKIYPNGYHCNPKLPLPFINIASQKNYISIYHMGLYTSSKTLDWFLAEWKKHSAKKIDMGKCCIRFKKAEDVPLELLKELVAKITPKQWIEFYEENYKK